MIFCEIILLKDSIETLCFYLKIIRSLAKICLILKLIQ